MAAKKYDVHALLEKVSELPTLPTVIYKIRAVIDDPMSSTADVEKVMSNDPSLTTKVLRLVNSAYYAIPGGVNHLSRAIAYLGFDTVHQLVISTSIIDTLKTPEHEHFKLADFWQHSLGTAIAAETIGRYLKFPRPSDLFTCGLVHDIGKIALYNVHPEAMISIVSLANKEKITYSEAELSLGIPSHTVIGHALAQKWTLPERLQAAVKHHHEKDYAVRGNLPDETQLMIDIVLFANLLCHALKFGNSGHPVINGAPKEVLKRLDLESPDGFRVLLMMIKSQLTHADSFLELLGVHR